MVEEETPFLIIASVLGMLKGKVKSPVPSKNPIAVKEWYVVL